RPPLNINNPSYTENWTDPQATTEISPSRLRCGPWVNGGRATRLSLGEWWDMGTPQVMTS
ncbi:hypothetical protein, partial [Kocuria rosea]